MNANVSQLSLKHRPRTFDEVRGQDFAVKELKARAAADKWPTALLFQGQTGVGKSTLGLLCAAAMQCGASRENGQPCGTCRSCIDIFDEKFSLGGTHMLDGSTSSKDDVIDRIQETIHTLPLQGRKHVFIIEEVDQLSTAAKNAFHKLLEKPSPWVHFILLSMTETNGNKVPESIATRCQLYHLKPLIEADVAYTLRGILKAEKLWDTLPTQFKKEGIFLLANNAKGSMRRAIQYLERVLLGELFTTEAIETSFQFISEETALATLRRIMGREIQGLTDVELLKNQNRLMDWVYLTFHFLVSALSERLRAISIESPSSKMLSKFSDVDIDLIIYKLYIPIQEVVQAQGYISNTQLLFHFITWFKTIEPIPVLPYLRTRGT